MERDAGLAAIPARAGWSRRSACRSGWVCMRLPAWLGDGSLSLVAHLAGGPGRLVADKFDLTAAALQASGDLAVDRSGAEPRLTGHVHSEAADAAAAERRLGRAAATWRSAWLARRCSAWDRPNWPWELGRCCATHPWRSRWQMVRCGLRISLRGWAPGTVSGSLAFDAAADPPSLAVQAKLRDARHHRPAGRCADRSAVGPRRCQRAARSERL